MPEENTFAGATLDRAAERRTDAGWLAAARSSDDSLALLPTSRAVPLMRENGARRPLTVPLPDALALTGAEPADAILLGLTDDGHPLFAVDGDGAEESDLRAVLGADAELGFLRDAAMTMSAPDAGLLAYTQALVTWQRTHRFCGRCGGPTTSTDGGHARHCAIDDTSTYPRTDPVVICVVADGDRILLGRQPSWPPGRYSALAGFVEPGESLEHAVAREIDEEAGIAVQAIRYHSSQPWPFPGNLMTGFIATYEGGEAHTKDEELEDVAWFTRDEVQEATGEDGWEEARVQAAGLLLPPRIAIARRLIESWLQT